MNWITLLIIGLSIQVSWASCKLPKKQKLTIGCSYHCDFFDRYRLRTSARVLGLRLNIIDLRHQHSNDKLASVDGVYMPGGADIDPKFYLDKVSDDLREYTMNNLHLVNYSNEGRVRDPFEYNLLQNYNTDDRYRDLPLIGICRGMQMMAVVKGLPLYLDIQTELNMKNRYYKLDRIFVSQPNSLMDILYPRGHFLGYKFHHQGIRLDYYQEHHRDFSDLLISSYSNSGKIAESLEYLDRPALGVQFHPERSTPKVKHAVYKWFLTKACEYKNSKVVK